MDEPAVISSLVVETTPGHAADVARQLATVDGVEVHEVNDANVVVTIESETVEASYAAAASFVGIEGVSGIQLVYANFEGLDEDEAVQR